MFDLLIQGATVVDPYNRVNSRADLGIRDGKVEEVSDRISSPALRTLDLEGKTVIPGVVDPHVHVSSRFGGPIGYQMMSKAGVTTAVDLAGPVEDIISALPRWGSGMNIAVLEGIAPGENLSCNDPDISEIEGLIDSAVGRGALGVKLLGGHYPLTPEATRRVIKAANEKRVYVAFHVGTTASASDLTGLREAVDLAGDDSIHLAHINSYLRGRVKEPLEECREALTLLASRRNIVSESYLGLINGTSGKCIDGVPQSKVTRDCLKRYGYTPDRDGLAKAILDGYSYVNVFRNGETGLYCGKDGLDCWENAGTDMGVSFNVNSPTSLFLCATAKDDRDDFIVDALSTDGGGIPRNVTVEKGLMLVKLGALSMDEFVTKASLNPSRMFGMVDKGHLGVGADADITILDLEKGKAVGTICNGEVNMIDGVITGRGGKLLTNKDSAASLESGGIDCGVVDLEKSLFYRR